MEFAYAVHAGGAPSLFRVFDGTAKDVRVLHLGGFDAFATFQKYRHAHEIDHAPDAIHRLSYALSGPEPAPKILGKAIDAMWRTFSARNERDVGGWVVPYVVTGERTYLCSYRISVSDPIAPQLEYGAIVPTGTAQRGGFDFSFTALRHQSGHIAYWLQKPGGIVARQIDGDWVLDAFAGSPSIFKQQAEALLKDEIDLGFDDTPFGTPTHLTFVSDQNGNPALAIARNKNAISTAWLSTPSDSFKTEVSIDLTDNALVEDQEGVSVSISSDPNFLVLQTKKSGVVLAETTLSADEVSKVITQMAAIRANMTPPVPADIGRGMQIAMVIDPKWRTNSAPHPSIPGPYVTFQHPGYGWLGFILPTHEAKSMGQWLVEDAKNAEMRSSGQSNPGEVAG